MRLVILFLVASLVASFGSSYAQSPPPISIYAQIKVQDANGNLVEYLESDTITITDLNLLNKLIDHNPDVFHKSAITIDGQKFDLIKASNVVVHSYPTIVSGDTITSSNATRQEILVEAYHDGYPAVPGDKVTTYWTILRPSS